MIFSVVLLLAQMAVLMRLLAALKALPEIVAMMERDLDPPSPAAPLSERDATLMVLGDLEATMRYRERTA